MSRFFRSLAHAFSRQSRFVQVAALLALSFVIALALELVRLPAAFLLGPLLAGICIENLGGKIKVPPLGINLAQAIVGLLIARTVTPEIVHTVADRWPLFAGFTLATLAFSALLGWWFVRLQLVPGTTAIWGLLPGGAGAVVLMAGDFGADPRLVAFMQYLRVLFVTVLASIVARVWGNGMGDGGNAAAASTSFFAQDWFPPLLTPGFLETAALIVAAIALGRVTRIANGTMLIAMFAGAWLHDAGLVHIELPLWLLAASYSCLGWSIGLRFTREVLQSASRALPATVLCIVVMIAVCGGLGVLMVCLLDTGALTAYLATSPGGADSVAIIAASTQVNAPLVMAFQTARLLAILAIGPTMARFIATRIKAV
jgi:membrane AbrB-like protein